jgi:hypothetical protein
VNVWNHYDAKAFASLLTEDGEWTDVVGQTAIGRKEVKDMHIYPFTTVLRETVLIFFCPFHIKPAFYKDWFVNSPTPLFLRTYSDILRI